MSDFRGQQGWIGQLITRMENMLAGLSGTHDDGGRLIGTPGTTVGVFPSDASVVAYTPAVDADWTGSADPGNTNDALDQLAARVTAGGGSDASLVTYTPADNSDWSGSADPGNADDAFDQLADRLHVVEGATTGSGTTDDVFVIAMAVAL